ncbi:MAG: hypothetical protein AAGE18_04880 [Pseudomonadota bacterium]
MRSALGLVVAVFFGTATIAQDVIPGAVAGFAEACLATAPDFSGLRAAADRAGFQQQDGLLALSDWSARVEVFPTEQGCACTTTLVAPDPDATAAEVLRVTAAAAVSFSDHPAREIAAVVGWQDGDNALQIESDRGGSVPLLRAMLLSRTPCPTL